MVGTDGTEGWSGTEQEGDIAGLPGKPQRGLGSTHVTRVVFSLGLKPQPAMAIWPISGSGEVAVGVGHSSDITLVGALTSIMLSCRRLSTMAAHQTHCKNPDSRTRPQEILTELVCSKAWAFLGCKYSLGQLRWRDINIVER